MKKSIREALGTGPEEGVTWAEHDRLVAERRAEGSGPKGFTVEQQIVLQKYA